MPETGNRYLVPLSIIAGSVVIAGALIFALSSHGGGAYQEGPPQGLVTTKAQIQARLAAEHEEAALLDAASIRPGDDRFIGKKDAPLTMTYWFDYQCPFCKAFEEQTLPALVKEYVNTGKLKVVFRDYAFLGKDSITASEYSRAVWDLYPDKFFEWNQAMFAAQDAEGDQGFGDAQTIEILTSLIPGIDVGKVKDRVEKQKDAYDRKIAEDQKEGSANGVQGTPGFKIGRETISGAQPLSAFEAAIEAQLK